MNKVKTRLVTIISFFVLLVLTLGLAFGLAVPAIKAGAVSTYSPSTVFAAGTSGEVGASSAEGDDPTFVEFTLKNEGKVHFRRDLALKWFEAVKPADEPADKDDGDTDAQADEPNDPEKKEGRFSMTFAFPSIGFKTFTISFESAEENISKDGKATNSIVFEYAANVLTVAVKDASQQDEDFEIEESMRHEIASDVTTKDFKVELKSTANGEFGVYLTTDALNATGEGEPIGTFTNIGGYFMEYRSAASTTPNTPITFTTELQGTESETAQTSQKVLMKELNGQSFELVDGKVQDDTDPVLVLNEEVYAFSLGQRFSLSYEAIDVCDDSVTVSRSYYMYNEEDAAPSLNETGDSHYKTLTTSTFFMPPKDKEEEEEYVSIRFKLDDGSNSVYVNLVWYAAEKAVVPKEHDAKTESTEGSDTPAEAEKVLFNYILVNRKTGGPAYTVISTEEEGTENKKAEDYKERVNAYQKAVTAAAENVSAGSGAYIYLPSLRNLISSDYADYRNLKFSIYYYKGNQDTSASASSQTSLNYNALKLEVDQMGYYKFRVLATDSAGNAIRLYDNGELVNVTSENIWDFDEIPEFNFYIDYKGATIEDAGEQTLGSRNATYSFSSFEIIALSGYETEYDLFYFDTTKLTAEDKNPKYSEFVENAETYTEETYKDALTAIRTFNEEVEEDSAEWDDTDNDYKWNPTSSLSFVPQKTGIYVLKVTVKDAAIPSFVETGYQVVEVRNPVDTIPGQSQWLQDNVVSVVLFSISAVLAVIIVVLLCVKPSDKSLDEVDLNKLKGVKKSAKKNK